MKKIDGDRPPWSDDQLREAVATQQSWRGVLRALGLRDTYTKAAFLAQRRAAELGLDASHFRQSRRWSDDQLRAAIPNAASWSEVLQALQLRESEATRLKIKGFAYRLGIDVRHLKEPTSSAASFTDDFKAPLDLTHLRVGAPAIAMVWFALRGYSTALPTEPTDYDLLVTTPSGIKRVQVKSTTSRTLNGRWQISVGHRPYVLDKSARKAPYDPEKFDFYFIVDGCGGTYLIPSAALAGQTNVYLDTFGAYRVGDASSLLT